MFYVRKRAIVCSYGNMKDCNDRHVTSVLATVRPTTEDGVASGHDISSVDNQSAVMYVIASKCVFADSRV